MYFCSWPNVQSKKKNRPNAEIKKDKASTQHTSKEQQQFLSYSIFQGSKQAVKVHFFPYTMVVKPSFLSVSTFSKDRSFLKFTFQGQTFQFNPASSLQPCRKPQVFSRYMQVASSLWITIDIRTLL